MNLIFLGPPGSGKGTQSSQLETIYGIKKLSTGDMLRQAIKDNTEIGQQAKSIIEKGELVSDQIMISMISERIKLEDCKKGFVLDGFPRTIAQAEALENVLNKMGKKIDAVLELKVDDNALVERISGRYSCGKCGESYNMKFKPSLVENVCDICGASDFKQRDDDKAETVMKRLNTYHN
jgi:adenylate kinase